MSIYQPYTYLIGWSRQNTFYYGVRYAKDCNPNDFWKTYFTSSDTVKDYIQVYGDPDIIQIRKTFITADQARLWEYKVLRRLDCAKSEYFLNKHNNMGFAVMSGDDNPSKRPEVKRKLSESSKNRKNNDNAKKGRMKCSQTKTRQGLISFIRNKNFKPSKSKETVKRIEKYIDYIKANYPQHKRILRSLNKRLNLCNNYIRKSYPSNRKGGKRGPTPSISESKKGKKWYYDPETLETRPFIPGEQPEHWVKGMVKRTPNVNSEDVKQKISSSMKQARQNEPQYQREKRLKKYHESIQNRNS